VFRVKKNAVTGKTMKKHYAETYFRAGALTGAGYKLVSIWERDWTAQAREQKAKEKARPNE